MRTTYTVCSIASCISRENSSFQPYLYSVDSPGNKCRAIIIQKYAKTTVSSCAMTAYRLIRDTFLHIPYLELTGYLRQNKIIDWKRVVPVHFLPSTGRLRVG